MGYFRSLLKEKWEAFTASNGQAQYKAAGKELYVLSDDLLLLKDNTLKKLVTLFSKNEARLQSVFVSAWGKLMEAGRQHPRTHSTTTTTSSSSGTTIAVEATA